MQKKLQQRKMLIILLAILIAISLISILTDKEERVNIVVVNEELDTTITVADQLGKFNMISIPASDYQRMGKSFVTNIQELKESNPLITVPLSVGSPIPKSLVEYSKNGGEFTNNTPIYRTWYKLSSSMTNLPPGVVAGDKVDIGVMYTDSESTKSAGKPIQSFAILYYDVEIAKIVGQDIYLSVTQEQSSNLTVTEKVGQFVLQIPGKKNTQNCMKLSTEQKEITDCYNEYDKPIDINTEDILKKLRDGVDMNNLKNIYELDEKYLVNDGHLLKLLKGENIDISNNENLIDEEELNFEKDGDESITNEKPKNSKDDEEEDEIKSITESVFGN